MLTPADFTRAMALGKPYPPLPVHPLTKTSVKIGLVALALSLLFAFHICGGALTAKVTAFGGLVMGGFTIALLPIACLVFYLGTRLLGVKMGKAISANQGFGVLVLIVIVLFALFASSRFLSKKCLASTPFSMQDYFDGLKMLGHVTWMGLVPFFATLWTYWQEERRTHGSFVYAVHSFAVARFWERTPEADRGRLLQEMTPVEKGLLYFRLPHQTVQGMIGRAAARRPDEVHFLRVVGERQWLLAQMNPTDLYTCFHSPELPEQAKELLGKFIHNDIRNWARTQASPDIQRFLATPTEDFGSNAWFAGLRFTDHEAWRPQDNL